MNIHDHHRSDLHGANTEFAEWTVPAGYHQNYQKSFQWPKFLSLSLPVTLLILGLLYSGFYALDFNPIHEFVWNCLVYSIPARLLRVLDNESNAQTHAAKSEVMRRLLGLDKASGMIETVAQAGRRRLSILPGMSLGEDGRPPGLGNWDNSCYQNSVLQGLASLDTLPDYLVDPRKLTQEIESVEDEESAEMKMSGSLRGLIKRLKDPLNNGKRIWTPATLKSMSSWQQQDAQEYFSKVLDEIDKEITRAAKAVRISQGLEPDDRGGKHRLERITERQGIDAVSKFTIRNPLEGLLAQRVGCTRCGYSEGLSMIPFNCLTIPLGKAWAYDISDCLDEYTSLEQIEGVECGKCTLLKTQRLLSIIMERTRDSPEGDKVRQSTLERLQIVTEALENDDYEDKTLNQKCKIPPKNRVTTTKSRQAVIARPPKSLAVHVNRSLFDEMTGELKKNYAEVRFPKVLDLGPWCLGSSGSSNEIHYEEWLLDPAQSMIASSKVTSRVRGPVYELRAVVTHYGRHENGHYICYRKHPVVYEDDEKELQHEQWWRLSDDDVMKVSEDNVLGQGGVFMLFYDIVEPASLDSSLIKHANAEPSASIARAATPADVVVAANTPLPDDSDDDLYSSDGGDSSMTRLSREQSIATSISEVGEEEYQPAKAILIAPYIGGTHNENESKEHTLQVTGSLVMV